MNENEQLPTSPVDEQDVPEAQPVVEDALPQNPEQGAPKAAALEAVPPPQTDAEINLAMRRQRLAFAAGFVGWYLLFGGIWLLFNNPGAYISPNFFLFPVNLILLLVLTIRRQTRPVGFGMLTAVALNLLIALIRGMAFLGWCFIPFFIDV